MNAAWFLSPRTTYPNANEFIFVRVKIKILRLAVNRRSNWQLYLDAGIDSADVVIQMETIQYESNVDVSASPSACSRVSTSYSTTSSTVIWSPVNSHSRSIGVVDRSRLAVHQLFSEVIWKTHLWHSTPQLAAVHIHFRQLARLQSTPRKLRSVERGGICPTAQL